MSVEKINVEISPDQIRSLAAERAMELSMGLTNGYIRTREQVANVLAELTRLVEALPK